MTISDKLLYSVPEAAEQLSVSPRVLERLLADGALDSVKIGRRRLVPSEALVSYVERVKKAS